MSNFINRLLIISFLTAALIFLCGPASAQQEQVTDADIDALIQQFLPEGVTLADATFTMHIEAAISQAVKAKPEWADQIVARAIEIRPDMAEAIQDAAGRGLKVAAARKAMGQEIAEKFKGGEGPPARDDNPASPVIP
jgi:acyl-CoA reductase-like NAD-dependent aldehyde dehydrogenase